MGSSKQASSGTTVINQTTTPKETPMERENNELDFANKQALNPFALELQKSGIQLGTNLLQGGSLPGYLNMLPGGIDDATTQSIVDQSLRDIQPMFQGAGILNSGAAASIAGRTAGDIRRNTAQYNQQNLQQLLNLAVGGQAIPLSSGLEQAGQLSQRLQGLRTTTTNGTSSYNSVTKSTPSFLQAASMFNPFMSAGFGMPTTFGFGGRG